MSGAEKEKTFNAPVRRLLNWRTVAANQSQILKLAKPGGKIRLRPTPPLRCGGTVDRYYHFLFDLALPLYCLFEKAAPGITFSVGEVGNFTHQLLNFFPEGVDISESSAVAEDTPEIPLIGMNPKCVSLSQRTLYRFKAAMCKRLGVKLDSKPNKVLLIERLPPDEYFFTKAKVQGGGASWRSIINHKELEPALKNIVKEPYEFHNLQLENISLEEQARYFSQALVVVAQHGAGLSNCIWMRKGTHVIELGYDEQDNHFETISKICHLNYLRYQTDSHHATVDIKDFTDHILSRPALKKYFQVATALR